MTTRAALVAALVLLLTSAWAVPTAQASSASCPSGTACVALTVVHDNGSAPDSTRYFSLSEITAVNDQGLSGYRLRSARGLQEPLDVPAATSVRRLLQLANIDPTAVTAVDVARTSSAGGSVALTGDPGDTEERGTVGYPFEGDNGDATRPLYPVFFTRGASEINFIRPLRAGDDSDVNTTDSFGTDAGGVIRMTAHTTGTSITPVVTASTTQAKIGEKVGFTAKVGGAQPSGTYTWTYGGVSLDESANTQHGWQKRGRYSVTVTVRTSDGSSGTSDAVVVQVGKKAETGDTGPPGSSGPKKDGPADGPVDGGGNGAGDPGSKGGSKNQGGTGTTPGSTSPTSAATSPAQQKTTPGKRAATDTSSGAQVSGVLLDAEQARSVSVPAPASADVAAAAARRGRDIPRDWRWLLGLVPLLLLGAGVARQTRWLNGRLPEPPWRQQ